METALSNNYCSSCGARIYDIEKIINRKTLSFKFITISALGTIFFVLLITFLAGYIFPVYEFSGDEIILNKERFIIASIAGSAAGIFLSSLLLTYILTEIKVKESVIGASIVIILFKGVDFILASTFTIAGIGVALLSCFAAFVGAWLGFYVKKNIKFKN